MEPQRWNIWDSLFPQWAREAAAREIFTITNRASVEWDEKLKDYVLLHHPSRDTRNEVRLPFEALRPGHSNDDLGIKIFSVVSVILLLAAPIFLLLVHCWTHGADHDGSVIGVAILLVLTAAGAVFALHNNFQKMDRDWRNSIQKFFDNDTRSKMLGIRSCMLTFRRFIKWRRSMAYLLVPAWIVFWVEFFALLWMAVTRNDAFKGFSYVEGSAAAAFLVVAFGTLCAIAILRRFRTDRRDPTMHLCVMLAEEIRYAVAMRPGVIN